MIVLLQSQVMRLEAFFDHLAISPFWLLKKSPTTRLTLNVEWVSRIQPVYVFDIPDVHNSPE